MRFPLASIWCVFVLALCREAFAAVSISKTNYHGWPDSYVMANGYVEAIVVPAIGRVMQFRLAGETEGPFWENRAVDGKAVDPKSNEWLNFGGDKTWPAPQADWPKITPRGWPPPVAFDSMAVEAVREGEKLRLKSPVDPHYGIRTERLIALAGSQMTIVTTYFKVEGEPRKVGVWIITQLREPTEVTIPQAGKWNKQSDDLPLDFREGDTISLRRHASKSTKVGAQASSMTWQNARWLFKVTSPRIPGAEYPDNDSSAEVYTNPDPLEYVELETLGPLKTMKIGDTLSQTNTYSLMAITPTPKPK